MLTKTFAALRRMFHSRLRRVIHIAAVQPLGGGVVLYAADVDGRRILLAASPRAICILDRYPSPQIPSLEEQPMLDG